MEIVFRYYPGGKTRALTFSYDDGLKEDVRLLEIMNRYGIRGTFHLNSSCIGSQRCVSAEEVKTVYQNHEVSCHSMTHPFLQQIPQEGIVTQMCEDRHRLEQLVGYPVRGMSYPYGQYDANVIAALKVLGIEYSRTVNATLGFALPEDFLQWHPTCHCKQDHLELYKQFCAPAPYAHMRLFYSWGHSDEWNGQWDKIEEICKTMSAHPDIWYATNIEIVNYIKAMRALRFTCDQTIVYNPSAISVWIAADNTCVEIKSGETKKLN